jgi:dipeptidyl aminopeptidase/acylaminoacyl peptidase
LPTNKPRPPRPDDLYRIAIPTDPRLSPDGSAVTFKVQRVGAAYDKYRTAIWLARLDDASEPRQLTIGAKRDGHARWSPDGRTIAFLSDRRTAVEEDPKAPKDREDGTQIHLLPADRPGEARRLTDLPRGVDAFEWSPDGKRFAVLSASRDADREADTRARRRLADAKPGEPPASDYRFLDRLGYQADSTGFVHTHTNQLWIVDAQSGVSRRVTDLRAGVNEIAWSPDGKRVAISTGAGRDHDIATSSRILVIDAETGRSTVAADGPQNVWFGPAWLDRKRIAVLGGALPHVFYGVEVRLFPADGSDTRGGTALTSAEEVMPSSTMNSDLAIGEDPRLVAIEDGRALLFLAPHRGATELWRVAVDGGASARLTEGRHYLSAFDAVTADGHTRVVAIRSSGTELPEVVAGEVPAAARRSGRSPGHVQLRPHSALNAELGRDVPFREPIERWVDVDGRSIQAWLIPAADGRGPRPTVVEIHGGPHTLYGWSPFLEFQVLAGAGMSVLYTNPRGSEGYGRAFNEANLNDWGEGPMRDVMACVDSFIESGHVDGDRLGVTGGSYGGYLTTWIIGHTQRFKAAFTARSVADMGLLFQVGDLSGSEWPLFEIGVMPWDDPERHRQLSPVTYAEAIRTPLLIQHAERDLRATIAQAEILFARLRRLRRPVRFMRVADESHELTRSGTPHRRVENLVQVRDWFGHFLVAGKRHLPPVPRTKHGI